MFSKEIFPHRRVDGTLTVEIATEICCPQY